MQKVLMTLDDLKAIPFGEVFAEGTVKNEPEGLFMTREHRGKELIWIAKKGGSPDHDWVIYTYWAENGRDYALNYGDKVYYADAQKLVNCDDEMLKHYRK